MRATGGGTMTRFRQVTSPASGLLRSLILDSVLFGNRRKPGGGASSSKFGWPPPTACRQRGRWWMRCAYPPYEAGSVVGWIRRAARSQGLGTAVARAASTRGRAVPPKFGIAGGGARHDRRRTTLRDCALRFWSLAARCPAVLRADRGDRGVTASQLASSSTSARVWAVSTRVDQRNRVSAFRALLRVGLQLLVVAHGTAFNAPSGAAADAGGW